MAPDAHKRWLFMRGSNQEKNLFLVGGRLWEVALTKCGYTWRFDSSFKKLSN